MRSPEVLTIGHSTHSAERFLSLLAIHRVVTLADVRRYPASRRLPHFNATELARTLGEAGIGYVKLGDELGGRRRSRRDSSATGRRVAGLAAYADHMATPEFARGLRRLEALARRRRTAVMCAEGDWRRCHRQLIAEALLARGWRVLHIDRHGRLEEHPPAGLAAPEEQGRLPYPG